VRMLILRDLLHTRHYVEVIFNVYITGIEVH